MHLEDFGANDIVIASSIMFISKSTKYIFDHHINLTTVDGTSLIFGGMTDDVRINVFVICMSSKKFV